MPSQNWGPLHWLWSSLKHVDSWHYAVDFLTYVCIWTCFIRAIFRLRVFLHAKVCLYRPSIPSFDTYRALWRRAIAAPLCQRFRGPQIASCQMTPPDVRATCLTLPSVIFRYWLWIVSKLHEDNLLWHDSIRVSCPLNRSLVLHSVSETSLADALIQAMLTLDRFDVMNPTSAKRVAFSSDTCRSCSCRHVFDWSVHSLLREYHFICHDVPSTQLVLGGIRGSSHETATTRSIKMYIKPVTRWSSNAIQSFDNKARQFNQEASSTTHLYILFFILQQTSWSTSKPW